MQHKLYIYTLSYSLLDVPIAIWPDPGKNRWVCQSGDELTSDEHERAVWQLLITDGERDFSAGSNEGGSESVLVSDILGQT